jgi:hypothetical protein
MYCILNVTRVFLFVIFSGEGNMKSEKEVLKRLQNLRKEYDWVSRCREEKGLGQKVGCVVRESRSKIIERLKNQIETLEWVLS